MKILNDALMYEAFGSKGVDDVYNILACASNNGHALYYLYSSGGSYSTFKRFFRMSDMRDNPLCFTFRLVLQNDCIRSELTFVYHRANLRDGNHFESHLSLAIRTMLWVALLGVMSRYSSINVCVKCIT
jgi:hypothetical protein